MEKSDDLRGMTKIPMRAVSKARPRVPDGGKAYMPKDYMDAKAEFANCLVELGIKPANYGGPVACEIVFGANEFWMELVPIEAVKPVGIGRNDIDNLVGFVMDASQDAGLIVNDSQVLSLDVTYKQKEG